MVEIDSLVEESIRCVASGNYPPELKRNLIHSLYSLHDGLDTSFTKLRIFDLLVENGYFYLFDPEDHPDYKANRNFFEYIKEKDMAFIRNCKLHGADFGDRTVVGYWVGEFRSEGEDGRPTVRSVRKLCAMAGRPLWRSFARAGLLSGIHALEPVLLDPLDLALNVVNGAAEQNDCSLLAIWYEFIPKLLKNSAKLPEDKLERLAELLWNDDCHHQLSALEFRPPKDIYADDGENTFMARWFDAYKEWDRQSRLDNDTLLKRIGRLLENNHLSGALELITEAEKLDPANKYLVLYKAFTALMLIQSGRMHMDAGVVDGAVRLFDKALADNPTDELAMFLYYGRALGYGLSGRQGEMRQDLARLDELAPGYIPQEYLAGLD